eukprot:1194559-Prorocentrum_minimum.AAC.1
MSGVSSSISSSAASASFASACATSSTPPPSASLRRFDSTRLFRRCRLRNCTASRSARSRSSSLAPTCSARASLAPTRSLRAVVTLRESVVVSDEQMTGSLPGPAGLEHRTSSRSHPSNRPLPGLTPGSSSRAFAAAPWLDPPICASGSGSGLGSSSGSGSGQRVSGYPAAGLDPRVCGCLPNPTPGSPGLGSPGCRLGAGSAARPLARSARPRPGAAGAAE